MRKILIRVWQGVLSPQKALRELIRLARNGTMSNKQKQEVLQVLTWVSKKSLNVNEAEEELRWIEKI